jgi:hypothetical protein
MYAQAAYQPRPTQPKGLVLARKHHDRSCEPMPLNHSINLSSRQNRHSTAQHSTGPISVVYLQPAKPATLRSTADRQPGRAGMQLRFVFFSRVVSRARQGRADGPGSGAQGQAGLRIPTGAHLLRPLRQTGMQQTLPASPSTEQPARRRHPTPPTQHMK